VGKTISEKKDGAIITKGEKLAKLSQKRGMAQLSQTLKSGQNHIRN
jgi:hypothetical protein